MSDYLRFLVSILRSILSLSFLPRSLDFALFCLSPFSLALYTSLSDNFFSLPSPSLSILRPILSLSLLPRSLYFALFCRANLSFEIHCKLDRGSSVIVKHPFVRN